MKAEELLNSTNDLFQEMGKECNSSDGERSMKETIIAFNSLTGKTLTESDGMLILALLKIARDQKRNITKNSTGKDIVAYATLYAEARLSERT